MVVVNELQGVVPGWHINNLEAFFNAMQRLHAHISGVHITLVEGGAGTSGWKCRLQIDTHTGQLSIVKDGDTYLSASARAIMEATQKIGNTTNQHV